jgi:hypothetical protein
MNIVIDLEKEHTLLPSYSLLTPRDRQQRILSPSQQLPGIKKTRVTAS